MEATRVVSTALALGIVLFSLGAGRGAAAEDDGDGCVDRIRGALYPVSVGDRSSPDFQIFVAWLCTRDFLSHEQALREGLASGTQVYGEPLEPGGSFSAEQRAAWRSEHCEGEFSAARADAVEARFRRLADRRALDEFSECRGGGRLDCSARIEGDFAVFNARYTEFNRSAKIVGLRVDGETVRASGWSSGDELAGHFVSHRVELEEKPKPVAFVLETEEGSCEARAVPRRDRRKFNPRRERRRSGD